eukprot:CAMPEP_0195512702 /NCGR_PEP_ID=MMETSP0794_2-20130614/4572_1 /TAXON_ID=515487 /ORGANISM="Stephanopyxis turris, Strain CCMP 815" /LENGTH=286 /DNA_ID=CAMNT_0040640549 /DNA_START=135 /DNA_END=995 /DNA_ORIENTATION=-
MFWLSVTIFFLVSNSSWSVAAFRSSSPFEFTTSSSVDSRFRHAAVNSFAEEDFPVPTPADVACIEDRQLQHGVQAFAVGCRCTHGFPQAFGFHPIERKVSSGLFRLSCPLLVKAIDEWERQGGVREMSDLVRASPDLREDFEKTLQRTAAVRRSVVDSFPGGLEKVQSKLGDNSERYLSSGIAGISQGQVDDVKCLHAHAADHLSRSDGGNDIGKEVLRRLREDRGVSVYGDRDCWKQCDPNHVPESSDWNYVPKKNRHKLRSTRRRRKMISDAASEVATQTNPTD